MSREDLTPEERRRWFALQAVAFGLEDQGQTGDRAKVVRSAVAFGKVQKLTRPEVELALDTPPAKLIRGAS